MIMPADRRAATRWDEYVQPLRELMRHRTGAVNAITLDELVPALGLPNRRAAEQLLEDHVGRLGFVVVAGGPGLWRPTSAEEINAYRGSLRRRHVALKDREEAITNAALLEGWRMLGDAFHEPPVAQPPASQPELFSLPADYLDAP
jgi:hypothetical protein